ncbi:MAG TPA: cytochrome c oxidase assembly protein [Thermomicrobiales bacterium]
MLSLLLPVLHAGQTPPTGFLSSDWFIDPTVVLAAIALLTGYFYWTGPRNRNVNNPAKPVTTGQRVAFVTGTIVFLIALGPPLDDWADSYLLSAHMLQHMLLMFVTGPLWLSGTPRWVFEPLAQRPLLNRIGAAVTHPVSVFFVANLIITIWHLPGPYDVALRYEPVHVAQHASFLVAAILSWWPVAAPVPAWSRLSLPLQCLYIFLMSVPSGIIGAFIAFAEPGVYHYYVTAPRLWGISVAADQEAAGVLMWVGGSVVYLAVISVLFFRWAAKEDAKESASRPAPRPHAQPTSGV